MHVCRNIKTLYNFEPPATAEEIRAAALQYVRKISGFPAPSAADRERSSGRWTRLPQRPPLFLGTWSRRPRPGTARPRRRGRMRAPCTGSASERAVKIHLVDGTSELFRNHFGAPSRRDSEGREVGATVGLLHSLWLLLSTPGVTHVACAFDHVVESFRNDLYAGYKTSAGIDPDLLRSSRSPNRRHARSGVVVWPMVEFEADDALATAAARFRDLAGVDQVVICSPGQGPGAGGDAASASSAGTVAGTSSSTRPA